ncbi:acetolactate synthase [Legionella moravica]|uniref:Acetolactate synthase n=1 Tax=Legionella moravica TaxID=39962 RepID=A0A378JU09_9GAMM|nr:acetolactate synthase AlsS [Legionella moravica]KTD31695.1 acetolactate synthase [Legionella moravica]STX62225.1 acetolactate synthase [Legionella moravica]
MGKLKGGQLVVKCLEAQGVEFVFGIPGAKIDTVFDALEDSSIQLVLCRHEQNAAFMAQAYGRLTGKPGVVLVTSGPGVSNLATGLLTATTEGDPIVAIGGNVPRSMALKESHQNTNNVALMAPVTKTSVEVLVPQMIPEVFANAFRCATAPKRGACFISLPQDVLTEMVNAPVIKPLADIRYGIAHQQSLQAVADTVNAAQFPVLLLGQEASRPENTQAIRALLDKTHLPTVGTFQAAGVVSRSLVSCFAGRVGLFCNQPGDQLLNKADVVITVGLNMAEYDPETWNVGKERTIIHIDYLPAKIHETYQPKYELLGDVDANIAALTDLLNASMVSQNDKHVKPYHDMHQKIIQSGEHLSKGNLLHPLHFIHELRNAIDDDAYVVCDIGSVYIWMARYFLSYEPHHLLFSNGQQTLGVGLPWAMAVNFVHPDKQIVSLSGDGGFLFSAMELENAVRHKQNFVHFIWRDNCYNMVKEQELMKYKRGSGVDFGTVDIINFAKAFGATGYELKHPSDFKSLLHETLAQKGPVIVDIPIDYSDNPKLFEAVSSGSGN